MITAMKNFAASPLILVLVGCATSTISPMNSDFSPPADAELVSGFELRDRYSLPKYIGGTAIYVDSVAVHHDYTETSTIVWKDTAGEWQRSQVIEVGPGGLLDIERKLVSNETSSLTNVQAERLDRLIRRADLYNSEVHRTGEIGIGAPRHVMAIVTPFGRTTMEWDGRLRGKSGAVADIVLGHD